MHITRFWNIFEIPTLFSCKRENSTDNGCSLPYFNKCIILEHNALFSYLISGIRTDLKSKYFTLGFPPLCDRWDPLGPPQIPGLLDFVVPMCIASRSTKTICYCFLLPSYGSHFLSFFSSLSDNYSYQKMEKWGVYYLSIQSSWPCLSHFLSQAKSRSLHLYE